MTQHEQQQHHHRQRIIAIANYSPLEDDDLLAHILGYTFAVGDCNFRSPLLVCRRWERVANRHHHKDEPSLPEAAFLAEIKSVCGRLDVLSGRRADKEKVIEEGKMRLLIQFVLNSLKNPKAFYYKKKHRREEETILQTHHQQDQQQQDVNKLSWPRQNPKAFVSVYTCVFSISCIIPYRFALYELMKAFVESLAAEVVENMVRAVAKSNNSSSPAIITDSPATLDDDDTLLMRRDLLSEWQRWCGIASHVQKIFRGGLHGSGYIKHKTLEGLVEITMAESILQSMNAAAPAGNKSSARLLQTVLQDLITERVRHQNNNNNESSPRQQPPPPRTKKRVARAKDRTEKPLELLSSTLEQVKKLQQASRD